MAEWRWMAAVLGGLALVGTTGRPARAEERMPDAQLLLDLDLLRETDVARDRSLLRRLGVLERMRLLETLRLLESTTHIPPGPRPPSTGDDKEGQTR